MTEAPFTITVYDGTIDSETLDDSIALYRQIYAEPPYLEGDAEFLGFANDLPRRVTQDNFRLVVGRLGSESLGFAMGHQLPTSTSWWSGAVTPISSEVTTERPARTFAVIELAVRHSRRRRGLGRLLHAHLVADLPEERRALLVRPDAEPAQSAYRSWGYLNVGKIQPFSGGPVYDAMISESRRLKA